MVEATAVDPHPEEPAAQASLEATLAVISLSKIETYIIYLLNEASITTALCIYASPPLTDA